MRITWAAVFLWGVFALATQAATPNFLVILTDDHGYGDVSTYQASDVQTPHIDRLAAAGMLFTNMRSNATVCSPARAAILTGRYPDRVGVPGVIRSDPGDSWGYLDPRVPTLADELRRAGYHTAAIGKWHLGLESPNLPNERGFDYFHGFLGDMMDSYTTHLREGVNYMRRDRETIHPTGHATDLFTQWAVDYLTARGKDRDRPGEQPFFLYLAYNAPHFPIEPPAEWLRRVRERHPGMDERRQRNVALIEHLDDGVGRVLAALRDAGLERDTLVVFTSDNGGELRVAQSNSPWRGGKQSHYDGGLRVPFIVRWPAQVPAASRSEHIGLTFDIHPTLRELAGLEQAKDSDARSLLPALRGEPTDPDREMYFVRREGGPEHAGKSYEAIIRGGWKLLQNTPGGAWELYNLREDPLEQTDLAASHESIKARLLLALQQHVQRGGQVAWQRRDDDR